MRVAFGATPVAERVVVDGNVITDSVTMGIDFAMRVADAPRTVAMAVGPGAVAG